MPYQTTETSTRTGTLSAVALGTLLLLSGSIFAAAVLTKQKNVETINANTSATVKHGLTDQEILIESERRHAKLDALAAEGAALEPTTQKPDDCKAQMNDADFETLADLNRDINCAGTTAPTVLLTGDVALSPSRVPRIYLGSVDSDGHTTHSVTFDCQGHSFTHSGIPFTMYYSSILQNCTLNGPTRGVWAFGFTQVINTTIINPYETGIIIEGDNADPDDDGINAPGAFVRNSTVRSTGNSVATGFAVLGDSEVIGSTAEGTNSGFQVSDRGFVTNGTAKLGNLGFYLDELAVARTSRAMNNSGNGFWLRPGAASAGTFGQASSCINCVAENNGGDGFFASGRASRTNPDDQAITVIQNGIAKGNAYNGYRLFDGVKVTGSKAENNGTNVNELPGYHCGNEVCPEYQAHFGFRLDYPDDPLSVAQVINGTASGNKNGALVGSTFSIQDGTYCNSAGQDVILKTGGTMSGKVTTTKIQNLGGTNTATRTVCGTTGTGGKPPNITQ